MNNLHSMNKIKSNLSNLKDKFKNLWLSQNTKLDTLDLVIVNMSKTYV